MAQKVTSNKKKTAAAKKKEATAKKKATAKRIIEAIYEAHGLITTAAEKAGIDRRTIYRYKDEFPTVAEAIEEAQERLYDTAESKIFEKIEEGDTTMIIFFAKTRMKHRGYVEKQEIEHIGPMKVVVEYEEGKKQR